MGMFRPTALISPHRVQGEQTSLFCCIYDAIKRAELLEGTPSDHLPPKESIFPDLLICSTATSSIEANIGHMRMIVCWGFLPSCRAQTKRII